MNWKLPNQLTVGRIVLAIGFFVLLALYEQGTWWGPWLLNAAFGVYVVAGITDILDGYLARKWKVTSDFGRMVDPIVDKVLVIGAFVMLTGNNFAMQADTVSKFEQDLPMWFTGGMFSAVQAWMVVGILVRELAVSAVRGYSESKGKVFPATVGGKVKMFIQSLAVCAVLFQMANMPNVAWALITKIVLVWLATLVTIISALVYVGKTSELLRADE